MNLVSARSFTQVELGLVVCSLGSVRRSGRGRQVMHVQKFAQAGFASHASERGVFSPSRLLIFLTLLLSTFIHRTRVDAPPSNAGTLSVVFSPNPLLNSAIICEHGESGSSMDDFSCILGLLLRHNDKDEIEPVLVVCKAPWLRLVSGSMARC